MGLMRACGLNPPAVIRGNAVLSRLVLNELMPCCCGVQF
jgi:hypothetical protein